MRLDKIKVTKKKLIWSFVASTSKAEGFTGLLDCRRAPLNGDAYGIWNQVRGRQNEGVIVVDRE